MVAFMHTESSPPLSIELPPSVRSPPHLRNSDAEDEADGQQQEQSDEDDPAAADAVKAPLDLDSLEDPPQGTGGGGDNPDGNIVTNPLAADGGDDGQSQAQTSRSQEARLREELHSLAEELQRRKRDRDTEEQEGGGGGAADTLDGGLGGSRELWGRLRSVTGALAQRLCEQLRLVLEPMVATKLQGDYRSGKRINMRRVIPYIASGFRKDKIWLRRTKPAKRDYQVRFVVLCRLVFCCVLRGGEARRGLFLVGTQVF